MGDPRWFHRNTLLEMYRSRPRLYYESKGGEVYGALISLKDGQKHKVSYGCDVGVSPYCFVLRFIFVWIFSMGEVAEIELFKSGKYFESYSPRKGWFNKYKEVIPD